MSVSVSKRGIPTGTGLSPTPKNWCFELKVVWGSNLWILGFRQWHVFCKEIPIPDQFEPDISEPKELLTFESRKSHKPENWGLILDRLLQGYSYPRPIWARHLRAERIIDFWAPKKLQARELGTHFGSSFARIVPSQTNLSPTIRGPRITDGRRSYKAEDAGFILHCVSSGSMCLSNSWLFCMCKCKGGNPRKIF